MPPTDDPAIEAAARRAYEAWRDNAPDVFGGAPMAWEDMHPNWKRGWLAVARAAQPPTKLCATCRFWGDESERATGREDRTCQSIESSPDGSVQGKAWLEAAGVEPSWSVLRCRADYGCENHEPTEEPPPSA